MDGRLVFVTHKSARLLAGGGETVSYILVQAGQPAQVAATTEEGTGLIALDPTLLAEATARS